MRRFFPGLFTPRTFPERIKTTQELNAELSQLIRDWDPAQGEDALMQQVGTLIGSGANALNEALVAAARKGFCKVAKGLVQEGADVNRVGECADTVLFDAIRAHNAPMVRTLVAAGADVNALKNGTPVLLWAMDYLYQNYMAPESEDLTEIGEILINHPTINPDTLSFPQTLNSAIRYEYSAGVARAIIARSATLANKAEIRQEALFQAIEFNNLNVVN